MKKPLLYIIDDEQDLSAIIAEVAEELNFDTKIMLSVDEFVTESENNIPDVIISDIVMPEINGLQLIRLLQSFPQSPLLVVMSGFGDEYFDRATEMAKAYDLKLLGTLRKPFDEQIIRSILEIAQQKLGASK
jgi:FixJ family two-component response regulator